jgi:hypothetical protein
LKSLRSCFQKILHFSWITDFELSEVNLLALMRGGRARWKVENETFNTLKNPGYSLEHNYGHGRPSSTGIRLISCNPNLLAKGFGSAGSGAQGIFRLSLILI